MAAKRSRRTRTRTIARSNPQTALSRSILKQLVTPRALGGPSVNVTRDILEFDPLDPQSRSLLATRALPRPITPVFKKGERNAPVPVPVHGPSDPNGSMPKADVLIVTWTVAEAEALAAVMTPGHSFRTWHSYRKGWGSFARYLGMPARASKQLACYALATVGNTRVLCVKSQLHMSQDKRIGTAAQPIPPVLKLWQQMISDVKPTLVITTGTAGAIGPSERLGDTVVAQVVRFDCKKQYKALNRGKNLDPYYCANALNMQKLATIAQPRMKINADELPKGSAQPKVIDVSNKVTDRNKGIVTTDFFDFDYGKPTSGPPSDLTGLGSAVEMGDAVLGLLRKPPMWVAVRNASDPQMDGKLPPPQRARAAAGIYQKYGYWTTICSAIACWAIVVSHLQGRGASRARRRKKGSSTARGVRGTAVGASRSKKPKGKQRAGGNKKGRR